MAIDPRIPLAVTPPEWNPLSFMEQLDRSRSSKLLQENQQVQNDLQKTAYADNMLARAADQGKDNPEAWDEGFTALARANVPGAAEQVGKWSRPYAEQFAQRGRMTNQGYAQQEMNARAAPQQRGAAGQTQAQPQDPFGAKTNAEVAKNLEGVQIMLQPLAGGAVRKKADLDTLVDSVVEAGHPEAAKFKTMFADGPLFKYQMDELYQKLKQQADAAQQRLSAGGVGAAPEPQPEYSTAMSEAGPVIQETPPGGGEPSFKFAPMGGSADPAFLPRPSTGGSGGGMAAAGAAGAADEQMIKAIGEYQMAPPPAAKNPLYRQAIMSAVLNKYPDYNEQDYPLIAKARQAFNVGRQGDTVRSINTAVNHLATMEKLAAALNNSESQTFNYYAQKWAEEFGGTAPSNVKTAGQIVGAEVVKGIVGSQNSAGEREEAAHMFSTASTPAQLFEAIKYTKELMGGQLSELRRQYKRTTQRDDFDRVMLSPEAREQLREGASHAGDEQDDRPDWAPR